MSLIILFTQGTPYFRALPTHDNISLLQQQPNLSLKFLGSAIISVRINYFDTPDV